LLCVKRVAAACHDWCCSCCSIVNITSMTIRHAPWCR
jgi:hypothetical protein